MGWIYLSIPNLQPLHCWSLGMDTWFHPTHPTHYWVHAFLSMLGLKLIQVIKEPLANSGPDLQESRCVSIYSKTHDFATVLQELSSIANYEWFLVRLLTMGPDQAKMFSQIVNISARFQNAFSISALFYQSNRRLNAIILSVRNLGNI